MTPARKTKKAVRPRWRESNTCPSRSSLAALTNTELHRMEADTLVGYINGRWTENLSRFNLHDKNKKGHLRPRWRELNTCPSRSSLAALTALSYTGCLKNLLIGYMNFGTNVLFGITPCTWYRRFLQCMAGRYGWMKAQPVCTIVSDVVLHEDNQGPWDNGHSRVGS